MQYGKFSFSQRRWRRAAVQLPAQYFIKGQSMRYSDCTILNLSRSGAGVLFPLHEALRATAPIFFEFQLPNTFAQMTIKGRLKNKNKRDDGVMGGIEFDTLLPEDMFARLS